MGSSEFDSSGDLTASNSWSYTYANVTEPISLFGDVCENGGLTVIFAILTFGSVAAVATYLYLNDHPLKLQAARKRCLTTSKIGNLLEEIFVAPFVPSNLETLVGFIYFFWFCMTITFGITRYYERKWGAENTAEQEPFNLMAYFFNCKGLDPYVVDYTPVHSGPTPLKRKGLLPFRFGKINRNKRDYEAVEGGMTFKEAEFFFGYHITWGILWLSLGALQIFKARSGWSEDSKVRHAAHRFFGRYFASVAFFSHLYMAFRMALRNIVNQAFVIRGQYFMIVVESFLLFVTGIYWAVQARRTDQKAEAEPDPTRKRRLKGDVKLFRAKHMVRMFFAWIQSVAGSGSVRLAAWLLWVMSKFFTQETRILLDRGFCQTHATSGFPIGCDDAKDSEVACFIPPGAPMADSIHCWKPVFINLAVMDLIIIWLEFVFLRLDPVVQAREEMQDFDQADKSASLSKFKAVSGFLLFFVLAIFNPYVTVPDVVLQGVVMVYALRVKTSALGMYVEGYFITYQGRTEEGEGLSAVLLRYIMFALAPLYGISIPSREEAPVHEHSD